MLREGWQKIILCIFAFGMAADADMPAIGATSSLSSNHVYEEESIAELQSTDDGETATAVKSSSSKLSLKAKIVGGTALAIVGMIGAKIPLTCYYRARRMEQSNKTFFNKFLEKMKSVVTPETHVTLTSWSVSSVNAKALKSGVATKPTTSESAKEILRSVYHDNYLLTKGSTEEDTAVNYSLPGTEAYIKIAKYHYYLFCSKQGTDFDGSRILENVEYYNEFVNYFFKKVIRNPKIDAVFSLTVFNPETRMKFIVALVGLLTIPVKK